MKELRTITAAFERQLKLERDAMPKELRETAEEMMHMLRAAKSKSFARSAVMKTLVLNKLDELETKYRGWKTGGPTPLTQKD